MKLISLNCNRDLFINRLLDLVKCEQPDVLCLQEAVPSVVSELESCFGYHSKFIPSVHCVLKGGQEVLEGVALLTSGEMLSSYEYYYYGKPQHIRDHVIDASTCPENDSNRNSQNELRAKPLLIVDVLMYGVVWTIATTHFTWAYYGYQKDNTFVWDPDESTISWQKRDLVTLFKQLERHKEIIFTADLNAPRGLEVFSSVSRRYKDNIPRVYTTSIDGQLHRAGNLPLMVDGLFTTRGYDVEEVSLKSGVSDHYAVVANIKKHDRKRDTENTASVG